LRILTFTSLFPNSVDPSYGIFIYHRTSNLADRPGNEVVVVSPVPYFPRWLKTQRWWKASQIPTAEKIGKLVVYHPRYPLLPKISMPLHALLMFLGSWRRCAKLNREARIDCIDAHFVYPDGMAAVLLGKVLGVPVTVSARGTDINLFSSFLLIRPMIRWTLKQSAAAIAVSAALKEKMKELGIDAGKIHVIPNGVDAASFRVIPKEDARRKLGLAEDGPILVSVGSLIPGKGHQLLIQAVGQIARIHPELRLYILGEGPFRVKLESLVAELRLTDRVQLLGKRPHEELPLWFSAADASCLVSSREGWPNVVSESLACGTPVVGARVGGIPEILHSPELGVLVEQTSESVAAGIEQVFAKHWNREEISGQTRARTWETVAAEVDEVLAAGVPQPDAPRTAKPNGAS
jgi:teichuronic acid biosynthesis glycosyltransferase TuaC